MKRMLCIGSMQMGGAETFLMKLYRNIDRSQYQFDFCEPLNIPGYYDDEIRQLGGRIFNAPIKTVDPRGYKRALQDLVQSENYRYVFRSSSNAAAFLDLKLAKEAGAVKCVARSSSSRERYLISELASYAGRRRYLKYIDLMLAPSINCGKHTFGDSYVKSEKFKIIHNGLDVDLYRRNDDFRTEFRRQNGWEDAFVVGHVGRFDRYKNQLFLVKVFSAIKKICPNARLLLIGNGVLYSKVVEVLISMGLKEDALLAGSRNDVHRLYSVMDVLVFPSIYEGLPNVVVEAQAAGLPCVISDVITKEVVATKLVRQISLERGSVFWAEKTLEIMKSSRGNVNNEMEAFRKKYDIKQIVRWFQDEVFER